MKLVKNLRGHLIVKKLSKSKLGVTLTMAMIMAMTLCTTAFASTTTDYAAIKTAITTSIKTEEIVALIALILGATVSFAILWWGSRKLVKAIVSAFKSGKIHF